jgi:phospholipase C
MPETSGNLPDAVYRALRSPRPGGGMSAIKHVVLLMQENRSFDHYFGDFPGARGFGDRNAVRLPTGHSVFSQPYQEKGRRHRVRPYLLPADGSEDTSTVHDWETGHQAWRDGWHDNWVTAKGLATMGYYDAQGVALYRELADTFTLCDAYHCSLMSETTSNRNYWFSGGDFSPGNNRVVNAHAHDLEKGGTYDEDGYDWDSYPQLLEKGGKSWKVYQPWDNFYDNNLEFHKQFKRIYHKVLTTAGISDKWHSLFLLYEYLLKRDQDKPGSDDTKRYLADLAKGAGLTEQENSLYQRGLRRYPATDEGDKYRGFIEEFRQDIRAGKLPEVSYLVAAEADTEHPGHPPGPGQEVVYQVLDAIASDQETWNSTVLLLSYDENDGLFDHMPPPVPDETHKSEEWWEGQPLGLGLRVPMIAVSPWTAGGYVCSQVFDHTSQVQFLEKLLNVRQEKMSKWRRTVAGDLMSVFDFSDSAAGRPEVPAGRRRARPLPYQPDAQAEWNPTGPGFRMTLSNSAAASAHLTVYPYSGEYPKPRHLDVLGTVQETVPVPGDRYDFTVIGPNGFRREFAGAATAKAADAELKVEITTTVSAAPRSLEITMANHSAQTMTLVVTPLEYEDSPHPGTYVLEPGGKDSHVVRTDDSHGWYDVQATISEAPGFRRRFMGHIENGTESITGDLM